jgi:hypothetical protein
MSQAKVDRNKEAKANRKKTVARQKRQHLAVVIGGWIVVLAIVGWAGSSAYSAYENSKPIETIYANLDAINDYTASLSSEE